MKLGERINKKNCPHCGIANPLINHVVSTPAALPRADGGFPSRWGMYACTSCGQALLARGVSLPPGEFDLDRPIVDVVIPDAKLAHEDIPDPARTFLQQAFETLHAPDAAGVMAGSAVDAMLKCMGYSKGSLYERIDQAVTDQKLTANMGEWAHSVRLGSNRPRHADEARPHLSPAEAKQSVEFAEALGQFLFVLTAKIGRGIASAKALEV